MLLTYIILASLTVMLISIIGIVSVNKTIREWTERNLQYLTTLATGVFLVVAYNLVTEITHTNYTLPVLLIAVLVGVFLAVLIDSLIPQSHHHHEPNDSSHTHSKAGAHRIILSDSIHNVTDGFLVATTFLIDVRLGLLTTLGILVHEVAQEISEFFVLRSAGYDIKKALQINFFTSGTILIGAISGYFIATSTENFIGLLLAIAAGIIIYTILRDLIPHSLANAKHSKNYGRHLLALSVGILIVGAISLVNADTHSHDTSHPEKHETHTNEEHHDTHNEEAHQETEESHPETTEEAEHAH